MFEGMERGELRTLYVIGENPAQSEADQTKARELLSGLDCLIVQDIYLTKTAQLADVVLPGSASWVESSGTVTNSERRVQRVRKALDPPGDARDDMWILTALARRLGHDWPDPVGEVVWDELRSLSPMHAGMRYERLVEHDGLQWPCPSEDHPGSQFLHGRLWQDPIEGPRAPLSVTPHSPPVEALDDEYPIRLTTGRRLESYNTGAQSNRYNSPLHRGETLDLSPEDAAELDLSDGEIALISSRRGSVTAPVRIDRSLRPWPGLHDLPLPRPGGDQHPDHRRHRPQVRDGGVQGGGDPGREGGPRVRSRGQRGGPAARARDGLMDLRLLLAVATDDEKQAVDAVLGPALVGLGRGPARGRRRASGPRRPRGPGPAPSAVARAGGGSGTGRLDKSRGAELHLRAADRAAGRRLRGGDLLRAAVGGRAAASGVARVR